MVLKTVIDGEVKNKAARLSDVWHIPEIIKNLFSFGILNENGCKMGIMTT